MNNCVRADIQSNRTIDLLKPRGVDFKVESRSTVWGVLENINSKFPVSFSDINDPKRISAVIESVSDAATVYINKGTDRSKQVELEYYFRIHPWRASFMAGLLFQADLELLKKDGIEDPYESIESKVDKLKQEAITHDIGKLCIPRDLLNLDRRLTPLEKEVFRSHAANGSAMLNALYFPERFGQSALLHHETYNSDGYYFVPADLIPRRVWSLKMADAIESMSSRGFGGIPMSYDEIWRAIDKDFQNNVFPPYIYPAFIKTFDNKLFKAFVSDKKMIEVF